jgi:hypothetical protein
LSIGEIVIAVAVVFLEFPVAWLAMTFCVSVFALFNLCALVLAGNQDCGCFGRFSVSRDVVLFVEALFLVAAVLSRPPWNATTRKFIEVARSFRNNRGYVCGVISGGAIVLAVPAIVFASGMNAQFVVVTSIDENLFQENENRCFSVRLSNSSIRPISVVGSKASCRCVAVLEEHLEIPARGARELKICVKADSRERFRHTVKLFLNDSVQSNCIFEIQGREF